MIPHSFIKFLNGQIKRLPRGISVFKHKRGDLETWEYIIEINNIKYQFDPVLTSIKDITQFKKRLPKDLLNSFVLYFYNRDGLVLTDDSIYELPQDILDLVAANLDEQTLLILSQTNKEINDIVKRHFTNIKNARYIKKLQNIRMNGNRDSSYGDFRYIPKYPYDQPLIIDGQIDQDVFKSLCGWENIFYYISEVVVPQSMTTEQWEIIAPQIISWYSGSDPISHLFDDRMAPLLRHCIKYQAYVNNREINYYSLEYFILEYASDLIESIYMDLGLYEEFLVLTPQFRNKLLSKGNYPIEHLKLIYHNLDMRKNKQLSQDYWPYAHLNTKHYPDFIDIGVISLDAIKHIIKNKIEYNKNIYNYHFELNRSYSSEVLEELKKYTPQSPPVIGMSLINLMIQFLNEEDQVKIHEYLRSLKNPLYDDIDINYREYVEDVQINELIEYAKIRTVKYYYKQGYYTYHVLVIYYKDDTGVMKNNLTIIKGYLLNEDYSPVKDNEIIGDHIITDFANAGPKYTKHDDFERVYHDNYSALALNLSEKHTFIMKWVNKRSAVSKND